MIKRQSNNPNDPFAQFGVEGAADKLPMLLKALVGKSGVLTEVVMGKKTVGSVVTEYMSMLTGSNMADKVISTLKKMGLYYPEDSSLNTAIYMKLFGSELATFGMWESDIRGIVGNGEWMINMAKKLMTVPSVKVDTLKAISLIDNTINVPTPAGFPLAMKLDVMSLIHLKGSASFSGIQSILELVSGGKPSKPITGAVVVNSTLVY